MKPFPDKFSLKLISASVLSKWRNGNKPQLDLTTQYGVVRYKGFVRLDNGSYLKRKRIPETYLISNEHDWKRN